MTEHLPCAECGCVTPDLVTGAVVYPHRPDLAEKPIWLCPCGAYCGCHPGTEEPLGSTAGPETRNARSYVHRVLDPLWQNADKSYAPGGNRKPQELRRIARGRVYKYLAAEMGLTKDECHTGMFTIDQCRQAYAILKKTSYADVRRWWKEVHRPARAKQ